MNQLSKSLYNLERVHSISLDEMEVYSVDKILKRYLRAAKERNIDYLFVHPIYKRYESLSVIDYNLQFLDTLYQKLGEKGLYVNAIGSISSY